MPKMKLNSFLSCYRLKLNGTHQLLVYDNDVNLLGDNIDTTKRNTETLIDANKEADLKVNAEKTKYVLLSRRQNSGQNPDRQLTDALEMWHSSDIWEWQ
jgi:hypothetical protein